MIVLFINYVVKDLTWNGKFCSLFWGEPWFTCERSCWTNAQEVGTKLDETNPKNRLCFGMVSTTETGKVYQIRQSDICAELQRATLASSGISNAGSIGFLLVKRRRSLSMPVSSSPKSSEKMEEKCRQDFMKDSGRGLWGRSSGKPSHNNKLIKRVWSVESSCC